MDIFILFFLFNKRVREVFYAEEWAANIAEQESLGLEENPQLMVGLEHEEPEA